MSNGYNAPIAEESIQFRAAGLSPNYGYSVDAIPFRLFDSASQISAWWSPLRDRQLRAELRKDSLIAGIVYGEVTRVKNTPFKIISEKDNKADLSQYQDLLNSANFGQGFRDFLNSIALDLLTQDNGCFVELIADGDDREITKVINEVEVRFIGKGERTGAIRGFASLDAGQCWRTYDPEYPVIYTNPYTHKMTIMHWTRILYRSQFRQNDELARGIGYCAMSRAFDAAKFVWALNTYHYEKLTGQAPKLIVFNQPINNLQQAIDSANTKGNNLDFEVFKQAQLIAPKSGGLGAQPLSAETLDLKDDSGIDYKSAVDIQVDILANAFGVDKREIWSAVTSGATKGDAEVQDAKSAGKGRADILQMIEDMINLNIMPPDVTFSFDVQDSIEDKRKAEIKQIRVNTRATQIQSQELNPLEARQMAAEDGDIDPEFLENQSVADDTTDAGSMQENEPQEEIDESNDVEEPDLESDEKAYSDVRVDFFNTFLNLAMNAATGQLRRSRFSEASKNLVNRTFQEAFREGVFAGAGGWVELDLEEIAAMRTAVNAQISYLSSFRNWLYESEPDFEQVLSRVQMWANKGLDSMYQNGYLLGAKNQLMEWHLGRTENHCDTCRVANGQVHRAKEWRKYNIVPKSDNLKCNGFNCDCKLEKATGKKANGRLDRIPTNNKVKL